MKIIIEPHHGNYLVVWDHGKTLRDIDPTMRIFDTVFGEMKCYVMGLVETDLDLKKHWITWVNDSVWLQDKSKNYSNWVERTFKMSGIGFNNIEQAQEFKDRLEKAIVWQQLKN